MPSQKRDRGPVHTAHVFSRLISEADDGMAVFGCSANPRCGEHEVRRKNAPSPFALRRRHEQQRMQERRARRGAQTA